MLSRLSWLLPIMSVIGGLSFGAVLYVNNALDVPWLSGESETGMPRIEIRIDDFCNSVKHVTVTVQLYPGSSSFTIESSVGSNSSTCKQPARAHIETVDMVLRDKEGRLVTTSGELTEGTFERAVTKGSNFWLPIAGKIDGRYGFADSALEVGFGEHAIQPILYLRNSRCKTEIGNHDRANAGYGCVPLRVVLRYANRLYELGAALPQTFNLAGGPQFSNVDRNQSSWVTTLLWQERLTAPSSDLGGTIASSEMRVFTRSSRWMQQLVTTAGSAVFGGVVAILLELLVAARPKEPPSGSSQRVRPPSDEDSGSGVAASKSGAESAETSKVQTATGLLSGHGHEEATGQVTRDYGQAGDAGHIARHTSERVPPEADSHSETTATTSNAKSAKVNRTEGPTGQEVGQSPKAAKEDVGAAQTSKLDSQPKLPESSGEHSPTAAADSPLGTTAANSTAKSAEADRTAAPTRPESGHNLKVAKEDVGAAHPSKTDRPPEGT